MGLAERLLDGEAEAHAPCSASARQRTHSPQAGLHAGRSMSRSRIPSPAKRTAGTRNQRGLKIGVGRTAAAQMPSSDRKQHAPDLESALKNLQAALEQLPSPPGSHGSAFPQREVQRQRLCSAESALSAAMEKLNASFPSVAVGNGEDDSSGMWCRGASTPASKSSPNVLDGSNTRRPRRGADWITPSPSSGRASMSGRSMPVTCERAMSRGPLTPRGSTVSSEYVTPQSSTRRASPCVQSNRWLGSSSSMTLWTTPERQLKRAASTGFVESGSSSKQGSFELERSLGFGNSLGCRSSLSTCSRTPDFSCCSPATPSRAIEPRGSWDSKAPGAPSQSASNAMTCSSPAEVAKQLSNVLALAAEARGLFPESGPLVDALRALVAEELAFLRVSASSGAAAGSQTSPQRMAEIKATAQMAAEVLQGALQNPMEEPASPAPTLGPSESRSPSFWAEAWSSQRDTHFEVQRSESQSWLRSPLFSDDPLQDASDSYWGQVEDSQPPAPALPQQLAAHSFGRFDGHQASANSQESTPPSADSKVVAQMFSSVAGDIRSTIAEIRASRSKAHQRLTPGAEGGA